MRKLERLRNNIWIPKKKICKSVFDRYIRIGKEFLLTMRNGDQGIGFYNGENITYTILNPFDNPCDNACTYVPFSGKCPYVSPEFLYFFTNFKKDSRYWIKTEKSVSPTGFLVLGYNKEWKNPESTCNGIRLGYIYKKSGKKMFHSVSYDDEENKYLDFREEGDDYNDLIYDPGGKHPEYRPNMPEYWRFVQG